MREYSAHALNYDLRAAAEIFANGSYFPNKFRILKGPSGSLLQGDFVKIKWLLNAFNSAHSVILVSEIRSSILCKC